VPLAMNLFARWSGCASRWRAAARRHRGARPGGHRTGDPHELPRKAQDAPEARAARRLRPEDRLLRPVPGGGREGSPLPVVPSGGEDVAGDGGPFITLPLVFTKDRRRSTNVGMYRMHVYDGTTTGMHWHVHKGGAQHYGLPGKRERMPVAVALGGDPATIYAASAPLPEDMDEMMFSGFLRKEPWSSSAAGRSTSSTGARRGDPRRIRRPGRAAGRGPLRRPYRVLLPRRRYPVFHLTCVTRRKDPIYPATIVGKPPMEDVYLGKATERIFLPLLRKIVPR